MGQQIGGDAQSGGIVRPWPCTRRSGWRQSGANTPESPSSRAAGARPTGSPSTRSSSTPPRAACSSAPTPRCARARPPRSASSWTTPARRSPRRRWWSGSGRPRRSDGVAGHGPAVHAIDDQSVNALRDFIAREYAAEGTLEEGGQPGPVRRIRRRWATASVVSGPASPRRARWRPAPRRSRRLLGPPGLVGGGRLLASCESAMRAGRERWRSVGATATSALSEPLRLRELPAREGDFRPT
jgi:hypothetical protein